jgi:TRAP-type C4-dicarboxylate transport system permease small subunit
MVSVFAMMCLATADAIGRYAFNQPIRGAYEITEQYLMVVVVFFGVCRAYREGAFVRVTFVADRLPRQVKVGVNYFVQAISILIGVIYFFCQIRQTLRSIISGMTLDVWNLPLWPAYAIAFLGLFLMTLALVFDLWRVRKGMSHLFKETPSPSLDG